MYKKGRRRRDEFGYRLVTALGLLYDHASVNLLPGEMKTGKFVARDIRLAIAGGIAVGRDSRSSSTSCWPAWSQASVDAGQPSEARPEGDRGANKEYFALEAQVKEMEAKQRSLTGVVGEADCLGAGDGRSDADGTGERPAQFPGPDRPEDREDDGRGIERSVPARHRPLPVHD